MFHNLEAEMARENVTVPMLSKCIGKTERATRNKLNGVTQFTWTEVQAIRDSFFPDMDLQYLFDKGVAKTCQ